MLSKVPYRISLSDGKHIEYKLFTYPDQSSNVELSTCFLNLDGRQVFNITVPASETDCDSVIMKLLLIKSAIINTFGIHTITVLFEYLPYARADRQFDGGWAVPLTAFMDTVTHVFDHVFVSCPHNPSALKYYSPYKVSVNENSERNLVNKINMRDPERAYSAVCFPDEGAKLRFSKLGFRQPIIYANKVRDMQTGKIVGFALDEITKNNLTDTGRVAIFDDICDGGATFIEVAKAIKAIKPDLKIDLYVVHGIFSKGLQLFSGHLSEIYCYNIVGANVSAEQIFQYNVLQGEI